MPTRYCKVPYVGNNPEMLFVYIYTLRTLLFPSEFTLLRQMMNKKGLMNNDMVYIIAAFILTFLSSLCRSDNQLTQTKPLLPEDPPLISEGGDFAIGFFSPTNSSKKLYIGIWYHNITERTVVWVANRDNPITTPSGKLAITNNSELVLLDSQGQTLWTTATTRRRNTGGGGGAAAGASAVLLSTGNFVLRSPNGMELWQSFDHPTDNILPTMRVLLSYKAHPATHLFAWKSPDDPSTGDFSFGMDPASNLELFIWKRELPYFRLSVANGNPVSGGMHRINGIDVIFYQTSINTGDESYYVYTVSPGSPYIRLSLDYTGKGRLLIWNNTKSLWGAVIEVPNSCDAYGFCGPFGYCDSTMAIPTCRCPDGFELLDSVNFSRGCQRREALKCGKGEYFMAVPNMKLPDKFLHIRNRSIEQCAAECTRNCSCMAYAYTRLGDGAVGDTSRCLVWAGDLIDMEKKIFEEALYIRLGESHDDQNKANLLKIVLPIIACVLLLALGALVWAYKSAGKRRKKRTMLEYLSSMDDSGDKNIMEFPFISFENIAVATSNFSDCNMIGKGGFGKVYKGMLEGTEEVAVKRLSKGSGQGTEEFKNEVVLIAKLQHKNLVKLLGCCIHEHERLLVYEYLPNKSLDYFLFDDARKSMLQWPRRFKIIQGIARGIMYLHHDSRLTIIHRDLKSSNILLDKEMNPKISDFGMAKIFRGADNQLHANTNRVVGTYGYMSPEYAMEGTFSVKSDTYSFGVLMLEIVSGLKISSSENLIMDFSNLISYAWNIWKEGEIENLVDYSIVENCSLDEVSRCIHIGLLCVQDNPSYRPLMSAVVFMLENKMTPLPTPKQPMYFSLRDCYQPEKTVDNKELSINDTGITILEGR